MPRPLQIRMGGYGPATTPFSRALKLIGDRVESRFGDTVQVKYVWNIMDLGYKAEDILWLVEDGILTLGYQSTSYFTDRVPELGVCDLPFLFATGGEARAAMDGALGRVLATAMERQMNYRIFGWFENGFRHISNRVRPVHLPEDLSGLRIRVLPSDVQARTFELLGAVPIKCDLTEAIRWIKEGTLDAQENPLANTVTYGVHNFHRFHTLSSHFYLSRPVFLHRQSVESWPPELTQVVQDAVQEAIGLQRGLSEEAENTSRAEIEAVGGEIVTPTAAEHDAFAAAVQPLIAEAGAAFPAEILSLLPRR